MEKSLLKKGDRVRVTVGARKGDEGTVTEIREGVTFSVQVQFGGIVTPTPYAPNELEYLLPSHIEDEFPAKGCSVAFIIVIIIAVLALFYVSIGSFSSNESEEKAKPLSDTVARIPNP